jgi:hypothetical protein
VPPVKITVVGCGKRTRLPGEHSKEIRAGQLNVLVERAFAEMGTVRGRPGWEILFYKAKITPCLIFALGKVREDRYQVGTNGQRVISGQWLYMTSCVWLLSMVLKVVFKIIILKNQNNV